MKVKPFVTIPTTANLAIIVFCLAGIIVSPCKATRDMSAIIHDAENKNHQSGLGANGQLQVSVKHKKIARKLDSPSCVDSPLQILRGKKKRSAKTCQVIAKKPAKYCTTIAIKSHCPNACNACDRYGSADSEGTFIFEGTKRDCKWNRKLRATPSTLIEISHWCQGDGIRETCRKTCSAFCASDVTSSPSVEPTSFPTAVPSLHVPTVIPCAEKVKSVIESKFGEVIDGSPQGYALDWLIEDIGDDDCNDQDKIIQRFVLAAFFFSTRGDNWKDRSGWLGSGDECAWKGLSCNSNKALTQISLDGNNLNGTIVDEIHALESLEYFDINSNEAVSGTIPQSIGRLEKLYYLHLGSNAHTGPIPDLSGLINLQQLYAYNNGLTGPITDQFEGMAKLMTLNLGGNALTGTVPVMTGSTALLSLYLYSNDLTGQITDQFEGMTNLNTIYLNSNALTGTIPDMRGLSNLQGLYFHGNGFTGQITSQFEGMTSLRRFYLNRNALTGNIPDLSANTDLYAVYLSNNDLKGGLDPALFELPKLQYLSLERNKLIGPIPDNFGGSTTLRYLYLNDNFLTGSIPDISGDGLQSIEYLFLHKNKMSDPVPDSLCTLRSNKGDQFKYLQADCAPRGNAQNECPSDCCTSCHVGKGLP